MPTDRRDLDVPARMLFRIGLGLLLLSLVFLFRYAVAQGWIGPAARIGLGAVVGAALVGSGLAVARRRRFFGVWLEGTGVAALYVTAFAAHRLYGMSDPTTALVQLAAVSAVGVTVAVHERSSTLAAVALVGALAAPLLLPGRIDTPGGDYSYVAVVLAVAAGLFLRRGWVTPLAATVVGSGSVVFVDTVLRVFDVAEASTAPQLQVGVAAVWAAGWLVPVGAAVTARFDDRVRAVVVPAVASVLVPLPAFGMSVLAWADADLRMVWAAVAVGMAVVHAAAAARHRIPVSRSVDTVVAVLFLGVATLLAFEGSAMVFTLAALGVAALVAARRVRLVGLEVAAHVVTAVAGLVWLGHLTTGDPAGLGSAVLDGAVPLLWAAAAVDPAPSSWPEATTPTRWGYGAAAHLGVMTWAAVRLGLPGAGLEAAVTAAWGTLGVAEMVAARPAGSRTLTFVGFGTVLVAVAKLILVDMATVDPVWRILTFAGFGLVLAAVGFWLGTRRDEGEEVQSDS